MANHVRSPAVLLGRAASLTGAGARRRRTRADARAERLEKLKADDRWKEGDDVLGLPKVRVQKLAIKKKVKKMIDEEDHSHPLTDEQITDRLQAEGIQVTRRTVAKYREDMRIPSTHQRRVRE